MKHIVLDTDDVNQLLQQQTLVEMLNEDFIHLMNDSIIIIIISLIILFIYSYVSYKNLKKEIDLKLNQEYHYFKNDKDLIQLEKDLIDKSELSKNLDLNINNVINRLTKYIYNYIIYKDDVTLKDILNQINNIHRLYTILITSNNSNIKHINQLYYNNLCKLQKFINLELKVHERLYSYNKVFLIFFKIRVVIVTYFLNKVLKTYDNSY